MERCSQRHRQVSSWPKEGEQGWRINCRNGGNIYNFWANKKSIPKAPCQISCSISPLFPEQFSFLWGLGHGSKKVVLSILGLQEATWSRLCFPTCSAPCLQGTNSPSLPDSLSPRPRGSFHFSLKPVFFITLRTKKHLLTSTQ